MSLEQAKKTGILNLSLEDTQRLKNVKLNDDSKALAR
jgi:hypothetical protein